MLERVTASSLSVGEGGKRGRESILGVRREVAMSQLRMGQGCVHFPAGKIKGQQIEGKPLHPPPPHPVSDQ